MAVSITEIYRSSNGDCWQLVGAAHSSSAVVRHVPNPPSGGRSTDTALAEFLSTGGVGPEHWALRRLLEGNMDDLTDV